MKFFTLFILILLSGCSGHLRHIDIPIPLPSIKADIPIEPYLPIYDLTAASTAAVVIKSYVSSIKLLQGENKALRELLS